MSKHYARRNKKENGEENFTSNGANSGNKDGNKRVNGSRHGRMGSDVKQDKFNDPSWYANNPQLLVDSASLAFSNAVGTEFSLESYTGNTYGRYGGSALPGVLSVAIAPLPGNTQETNSPVNMAARQIYGFVRHANSGSSNYDIPNLMMYLLSMDSLYSMYAYLVRAYGIISYYSVKNRYTGKAIIESMGLDYDDLLKNLANYRTYINTFADKIGALVVPKGMPYFIRHMWLYSNVYRDADHEKSQFYIYNPEYFYIYNETAGTGRKIGSLVPYFFKGYVSGYDKSQAGLKKYSDIVELVNGMIDKVMESEDCGIMSGDIQKAYGESGIWKLSTIPAEFNITPVFDLEVLTQFHNIFTISDSSEGIPVTFGTVSEDIVGTELAPILKVDNTCGAHADYSTPRRILDLPYSNADPAHVMVATRLNAVCYSQGAEDPQNPIPYENTVIECGSEVACYFELYKFNTMAGHFVIDKKQFGTVFDITEVILDDTFGDIGHKYVDCVNDIEKFAFHPYIYAVYVDGKTYIKWIDGDVDNYTTVGIEELRKMNQTALLSEFDTPQAAVWSLGR
nr:MAG: putative capsid protein [Picobirnavirus sp.]